MSKKGKKSSRDQKRKTKLAQREKKRKERQKRQQRQADPTRHENTVSLGELLQQRLQSMWSMEQIRAMETETIIGKLSELGIEFDEEVFRSAVLQHYSPSTLSDDLWDEQIELIDGPDADFPWLAASVLWERLYPDVVSADTIDDGIEAGNRLLKRDAEAACDRWLQVWGELRSRFLEGTSTVETVDQRIGDMYSIPRWLTLLTEELGNVGVQNPDYLKKRITFCTEVCESLPDSPPDFLAPLGRAIAQSHFMLGDAELSTDPGSVEDTTES